MTVFLAWLLIQAAKVYDWFGDFYHEARTIITHVWEWVWHAAGEAFAWAKAWAVGAIQDASAWLYEQLTAGIEVVKAFIDALIHGLQELREWVDAVRLELIGWVEDLLAASWQGFTAWVVSVTNGILGHLEGVIAGGLDWLSSLFNPLLPLSSQVSKLISLTDGNIFANLLHLAGDGYTGLVVFLDNPSKYILGGIQDHFISFLCERIARALGSVQAELPDKSDWKG